MQLIDQALSDSRSSRYLPSWLVTLVYLLFAVMILLRLDYRQPIIKDLVEWRTPQQGLAEARHRNMPALLWFTADFCKPCKQMEAGTFSNRQAAQSLNSLFVPIRVDYEKSEAKKLAHAYLIEVAFPQLVILRPNQIDSNASKEDMKRLLGCADRHRLRSFIRAFSKTGQSDTARKNRKTESISWRPLTEADAAYKDKKQPVFVCYASDEELDAISSTISSNAELTKFIKGHFTCIRLSQSTYKNLDKSSLVAKELRKFGLKESPSYLVLSPNLPRPIYLVAYSAWYDTAGLSKFLERANNDCEQAQKTYKDVEHDPKKKRGPD